MNSGLLNEEQFSVVTETLKQGCPNSFSSDGHIHKNIGGAVPLTRN